MIPNLARKVCPVCKRGNRGSAKFCVGCGSAFCKPEESDTLDLGDFAESADVIPDKKDPQGNKKNLIKDRFETLDKIFEDSHGKVSVAYDHKRERKVIVKEDFEYPNDADTLQIARERFKRDADVLSMTNYKYIPRIIDAFFEGKKYFVIMKRVRGRSLDCLMKNGQNYNAGLPLHQSIKIILSLCDLVELLHKNNPTIVHRNIKPSKIMINTSKKVVLLPWVPRPAKQGSLIGTKGYASPEQYRGEYDIASDIYGIGATFYSILTGKDPKTDAPFHFIPISIMRTDVTRELEMVISKSLQLQPENRYRKVSDFKEALFTAARKFFEKK